MTGRVRGAASSPDVIACALCGHPRIPADHEAHGRLLRESRAARNAASAATDEPWTPARGVRARRDAARRLPPVTPDGRADPDDLPRDAGGCE